MSHCSNGFQCEPWTNESNETCKVITNDIHQSTIHTSHGYSSGYSVCLILVLIRNCMIFVFDKVNSVLPHWLTSTSFRMSWMCSSLISVLLTIGMQFLLPHGWTSRRRWLSTVRKWKQCRQDDVDYAEMRIVIDLCT
jgi:hypothetical protein